MDFATDLFSINYKISIKKSISSKALHAWSGVRHPKFWVALVSALTLPTLLSEKRSDIAGASEIAAAGTQNLSQRKVSSLQ